PSFSFSVPNCPRHHAAAHSVTMLANVAYTANDVKQAGPSLKETRSSAVFRLRASASAWVGEQRPPAILQLVSWRHECLSRVRRWRGSRKSNPSYRSSAGRRIGTTLPPGLGERQPTRRACPSCVGCVRGR